MPQFFLILWGIVAIIIGTKLPFLFGFITMFAAIWWTAVNGKGGLEAIMPFVIGAVFIVGLTIGMINRYIQTNDFTDVNIGNLFTVSEDKSESHPTTVSKDDINVKKKADGTFEVTIIERSK